MQEPDCEILGASSLPGMSTPWKKFYALVQDLDETRSHKNQDYKVSVCVSLPLSQSYQRRFTPSSSQPLTDIKVMVLKEMSPNPTLKPNVINVRVMDI